jgi:hypothetical protein
MNYQHADFIHALSAKTFNKKIAWERLSDVPVQLSTIFSSINYSESFYCSVDTGSIYLIHGLNKISSNSEFLFYVYLFKDNQLLKLNVNDGDIYQLKNSINSYLAYCDNIFNSFNNEINQK